MFATVIKGTVIPQKLKIQESEVKKALKSEFFRQFAVEHKRNVEGNLRLVSEACGQDNEMSWKCRNLVHCSSPIKISKKT